MRKIFFLLGVGLVPLLAGCSTTQSVAVAPVGPNPNVSESAATSTGSLEVYSKIARRHDDREEGGDGMPGWSQHVAFTVYKDGKSVKHVEENAAAHYSKTPERVLLDPGDYIVKTESADYVSVDVPVKIVRGRTTRVHLDNNWNPPADAPKNELVTLPDGKPVGWVTTDSK